MPDEEMDIPDWLKTAIETEPETKPAAAKAGKKATRVQFTSTQMAILAALTLFLCFICVGIMGVAFLGRDVLFNSPGQEVAAIPLPQEATPLPTSTPSNTPTPQPKVALPEAMPSPEPSPTATYAVAPDFVNKEKITEIETFVKKWRQIRLDGEIPTILLNRTQLQEKWQESSVDKAVIEAVQTQQDFYKALGLMEPEADLTQAGLEFQTNNILGYYDPEERAMYIIAESVNMFAQEEMTFAHEYTHALQDYNFGLSTILDMDASGDAQLAARSLIEGDARYVENIYTQRNITDEQIEYNTYRYLFQEQFHFEGISPALGILVYFPYTAGEYFVGYLVLEGGYSWEKVNQAYANPPISTEQVLHPEKYLAGERPISVALPDLTTVLDAPWHEIDRNVLGEIGLLVWLADGLDSLQAADAAAGWDGDAYALWVDDADQRLLVELSTWESPTEATQFLEAFNTYMSLREGEAINEGGAYMWEYQDGNTFAYQNEQQVLIITAPDQVTLDNVRSQFNGFY